MPDKDAGYLGDLGRRAVRTVTATTERLDEVPTDGTEESSVRVHRAPDADFEEYGVSYQRCGGGRRVIRKGRSN